MAAANNQRNPREPQAHVEYLFRRLSRTLRGAADKTGPKDVHQFRTTVRRISALAGSLSLAGEKDVARLQRTLDRLFEKAGKVRDVDVQIDAVRSLTLPSIAEDKSELLQILQRQRDKRAQRLASALEDALDDSLPKRQRKAKALFSQAIRGNGAGHAVLDSRLELMPFLEKIRANNFTDQTLHKFRLEVKHLRYTAEAAGHAGREIAEGLKPLQDAIGDWHDWRNLCELAEKKLSHSGRPIVAILRTKVNARFAQAQLAMKETYNALSGISGATTAKRIGSMKVQPIRPESARAS